MGSTDVFALDIHADYRCRHSGACCSADWDVPVEIPVFRNLREAVSSARLRPRASARHLDPFISGPDLPRDVGAMLERTDAGECVFLEAGSRLCIVHRDLGEESLPATCRHFPRLAVRDGRGTFITLSHFCPTAASMLFRDDGDLTIVASPKAFPQGDYDGLVVSGDDLPPLLSPTMLMDAPGYSAWERHMVARCAAPDRSPESVVATLWRDAQELRGWKPGGPATLADAVRCLPRAYVDEAPQGGLDASLRLYAEVMAAVPDELRPAPDEDALDTAFGQHVEPVWHHFHRPLNRYVAAKAFASWTAYQGRGVATIVRGLEAAVALVRVEAARQCRKADRDLEDTLLLEAIRCADFALNHLAVGEDLARAWCAAES